MSPRDMLVTVLSRFLCWLAWKSGRGGHLRRGADLHCVFCGKLVT